MRAKKRRENANAYFFPTKLAWERRIPVLVLFFSFFMMSHIDKTSWQSLKKVASGLFTILVKESEKSKSRPKNRKLLFKKIEKVNSQSALISILQERERLSNHFNKCITSSPVAIPGRLIQATQKQSWGGDFQSLAQQDTLRVYQLLQKYRQLVDTGELCAGDCPNDGVSCSSGVCRAHLR